MYFFFQTLTYVVHEIKMQNLAGLRFEAEMFFLTDGGRFSFLKGSIKSFLKQGLSDLTRLNNSRTF